MTSTMFSPQQSPIASHEIACAVQADDIDELGHVNNVVYLRWVQQVAVAHWNSLTSPALREALVWVALRHEIDYKAEALPGDSIIARTWTGAGKGVRYDRHTHILRARDGALLAVALTVYCPMHAVSRKPIRLSPDVAAYFAKR
jgi:acyl-CoA thioester hydrolase